MLKNPLFILTRRVSFWGNAVGFGFRGKQLDDDITPVAGLALVGHYLQRIDPLFKRLDAQFPCRGGLPPSTLIRSYVGLLAQSKSDFDATRGFRGDRFFKAALGLVGVPSSPTLRQCLDAKAAQWFDLNSQMIETLRCGARGVHHNGGVRAAGHGGAENVE
jgi:hypothetical protein